jgi:hypothetical protein
MYKNWDDNKTPSSADTANRSTKKTGPAERGRGLSGTQRRPLSKHVTRANAKRSSVRSAVERVRSSQQHRIWLFFRTIDIARPDQGW